MGNSSDPADLGLTEIETFLQVGLPAPIIEWPLLDHAGLQPDMIDGPTVTDLPPRLYLAYVDFMWLPQDRPAATRCCFRSCPACLATSRPTSSA